MAGTRSAWRDRKIRDACARRDNYMCCRCGTPIDPTLHHTHPMSISLEHLIPVRDGGLTIMSNCSVSHADCNKRAGGHLGAERYSKLRTSRDW